MAITVISMGLLSVEIPGQVQVDPGPVDEMTLRSLIFDHLASQHDSALPGILLDAQGQPKPGYAILVGGRNAMQLGGLDIPVKDGSTVIMTAMVSGG